MLHILLRLHWSVCPSSSEPRPRPYRHLVNGKLRICILMARGIYMLISTEYFKDRIEHKLLINTPLSHMRGCRAPGPVQCWIVQGHHDMAFLFYCMEKRSGRSNGRNGLPIFLSRILEYLLNFDSRNDDKGAAVRQQYETELLRIIASDLSLFKTRAFQQTTNGPIRYGSHFNQYGMNYMNNQDLNASDLLVAAAAVEDLQILK